MLDAVLVFNEGENELEMAKVLADLKQECFQDAILRREVEQAMFLLPTVVSNTSMGTCTLQVDKIAPFCHES